MGALGQFGGTGPQLPARSDPVLRDAGVSGGAWGQGLRTDAVSALRIDAVLPESRQARTCSSRRVLLIAFKIRQPGNLSWTAETYLAARPTAELEAVESVRWNGNALTP
jgi:hypothetical protein